MADDLLATSATATQPSASEELLLDEPSTIGNKGHQIPSAPTTTTSSENTVDINDQEGDERDEETCCSSFALGKRQIFAVMTQIFISKYRTPFSTCMELFSPVLMMLVLVAAYQLSEITYEDARTYDTVSIDVPGPWIHLANELAQVRNFAADLPTRRQMLVERLEALNEDQRPEGVKAKVTSMPFLLGNENDVEKMQMWNQPFDQVIQLFHEGSQSTSQGYQESRRVQGVENDDSFTEDGDLDIFGLLDQAQGQISNLLKNPLPIPTLPEYVGISRTLSTLFDTDDLPRVFSDSSFGRQWGNLLTLGTLHLSPGDSQVTQAFERYLLDSFPAITDQEWLKIHVHEHEQAALNYIDATHNTERTWALLDFSKFPSQQSFALNQADRIQFKIRMNYTTLPNTNEIVDFVSIGLNTDYQRYYLSGYLTLQQTLDQFAMDYYAGQNEGTDSCTTEDGSIWSMPMPTASYEQNAFYLAVGYLLGLTIAMAYLYPTSRLIKGIVEEKETKIKETLLIMGLKPWAHWWAWLLSALLMFGLIAMLVTRTLAANVLTHSSSVYLFWWIFFFSTSTVGFCFTMAALFSKAKLSAILGPMALFATLLPRFIFFGYNRYEASTAKKFASLLPATAFSFGADIVADYEYAEQGIQEWNAGEGEYSFNTSVGFLFLDTILYIGLGWYLDQVVPREYGSPRPAWFLFLPSFWCGCFMRNKKSQQGTNSLALNEGDESNLSEMDHEPVTDRNLVPRVVACDLFKVYSKKKDAVPAVNHLNMELYESQITTLLGHNGAGKTTTISLLTGLFRPTSGDAFVYGNSITGNSGAARRSIGFCPQQNTLFDHLTVKEHIFFYQRLKGLKPTIEEAREKAREIGLEEFFHVTSAALSGGNKRKLCVAAALCGDPKFLVLDEPTSGMDPSARRRTWDVLRRRRVGRTVLLCTHFMDESDVLSDRILIMKGGKLQCSGSPLFLKQRWAIGYNFTAVLELTPKEESEVGEADVEGFEPQASSAEAAADRLLAFTQGLVPGSEIHRIGGKEVTIKLPIKTEQLFPNLFHELELQRRSLSVGAYGVENASLEEVFIQLADDDSDGCDADGDEASDAEMTDELDPVDVTESASCFAQIGLLYWKRTVYQKRDPKGLFFSVVVPVLLVALVLLILTINVPIVGPSIEVSPRLFRVSNIGEPAETDVVVGGGISSSVDEVEMKYKDLREWSLKNYKHLLFDRKQDAMSSQEASRFLLDSINTHDHNERYGSFVLDDRVNIDISVDWSRISSGLEDLLETLEDLDGEPVDLLETVFGDQDDGGFSWSLNTTLTDIINDLRLSNASVSLFLPRNLTDAALETLFFGANFSRSHFEAEMTRIFDESALGNDFDAWINETLRDAFQIVADRFNATEFVDSIVSFVNQTIDNWNMTYLVENLPSLLSGNQSLNDLWNLTQLEEDVWTFVNETAHERNMTEITEEVISVFESALADEETKLEATGFQFNEMLVAQELGDMLVAVLDENVGSRLGWKSEYARDAVNGTLSGSDPSVLVAVWLITRLDKAIKENSSEDKEGWDIQLSATSVTEWFDVDVDKHRSFRAELESAWLYPSEGTISVTGLSVMMDSDVLFERDYFNASLSGLSWPSELGELDEQKYSFHVDTESSIIHNASSPHAVAAFNQHYMEYLFKRCTGQLDIRLVSENHPLPLTTQQSLEIKTMLSILASMFILIPYCFIPGAFIVFIVRERSCKSKHIQLVSGTNLTPFWVSHYLFDVSRFVVLTLLVMMVFLIYGKDSAQVFVGTSEAFWCTTLLTLGYGLSVLPFSYLFARRFDNHSSAQIAVIGVVFITGFVAVNAYYIMSTIEKTQSIADSLRPVFRLWPAYNVGDGLIAMSIAFWDREVLGGDSSPFDWDVAGKPLALLYGLILPYFLLLLFFEFSHDGGAGGLFGRVLRRMSDAFAKSALSCYGVTERDGSLVLDDGLRDDVDGWDSDVLEEEIHVRENSEALKESAPVLFRDLWKIYLPSVGLFGSFMGNFKRFLRCLCCGCRRQRDDEARRALQPKRAVRGMSTAVQEGEIYALLGANGAGKSTTLNMLTGDVAPTSGDIYVAGYDATGRDNLDGVTKARQHLGYCPQIDPLLDLMTVRETLVLYGRLRGIARNRVDQVVNRLIRQLMLVPHAEKTCVSLSGGNKRKLSLGIALIGGPRVLLIDESSSGLDPLAKRRMWNLISSVSKDKTVVLTTHSMEEAEALCTRAGIMAKGQLLCLGSVQHLKTKYLDGYTIDVFCAANSSDAEVDQVVHEILRVALPGSKLSERYGRFLRFEFSNASAVGLGATFQNLEGLKQCSDNSMESYSISQCSLEQVFVQLSGGASANGSDVLPGNESRAGSTASLHETSIDEDDDDDAEKRSAAIEEFVSVQSKGLEL